MGGNGVGLDSGGGSRGASFGGLGMRAIISPFGLMHHKPDAQPRPRGGLRLVWLVLLGVMSNGRQTTSEIVVSNQT